MRKRITAILSAIALFITMEAMASGNIRADVNGDGKVNTADVVEVYNFILNMREATSITIGDFPTTGWSDDETIGTLDEGKTSWGVDDEVNLSLESPALGEKIYTLTYDGENWTADTEIAFTYLANEDYTATAVYSPSGEAGTVEYLEGECTIEEGKISINFSGRESSRLRIVTLPNKVLTVTTMGFTPAGAETEAAVVYTLTADEKGNAYLYGTFVAGATVTVKSGETTLAEHTFDTASEAGKSYAIDAIPIIDLSQYADGATVNITEDCVIIGDGTEYNITLNVATDATVIFEVGTSGVKLNGQITVADGKTLTLRVQGDSEHIVNGGISLGNGSNVIIEGDLTKENNKLTVTATDGNAGIGANGGVTAGDITVRNARVDAMGSSSSDSSLHYISGAGIGTANASMGYILIENSIVTAAGGYYTGGTSDNDSHAAAIGMGSYGGTMGNITLINSEITASNNGDGLASVIGAGSYHIYGGSSTLANGNMGDIVITNTDLNLSMAIGTKTCYAAMIGPGMGYSYLWVNMGKIIFTNVTQVKLGEMIATWSIPSDFNEWGAYALGRGYDGSAYKKETFGGVWVSDSNGGTVQIGGENGYYCLNEAKQ